MILLEHTPIQFDDRTNRAETPGLMLCSAYGLIRIKGVSRFSVLGSRLALPEQRSHLYWLGSSAAGCSLHRGATFPFAASHRQTSFSFGACRRPVMAELLITFFQSTAGTSLLSAEWALVAPIFSLWIGPGLSVLGDCGALLLLLCREIKTLYGVGCYVV